MSYEPKALEAQALERFRSGDTDGALQVVETLLQLDGGYPFGNELNRRLRGAIDEGLRSAVLDRIAGRRGRLPVICHRCHVDIPDGEGFWVDLDLTTIGRVAKGHLYCSQCVETLYREAIGQVAVYADDVAPRIPKGIRSNFLGWLQAKLDQRLAPKQFADEKTEMRREIARQTKSQLSRLGGSKEAWHRHCQQRALWWWDHHGRGLHAR